jgi:hypothetical protein
MHVHEVRDAALKSHMMAHGSQQNAREPTKRAVRQTILSPHCRQRRPDSRPGISWPQRISRRPSASVEDRPYL